MIRLIAFTTIVLLCAMSSFAETPAEELNRKGNDLARDGKFKEAVVLYSRAIELDPAYPEPYYNRGKAKLNLKDYREAIKDFNLALKLDPKNADTYNNRGIAKKKLDDVKGAIADYTLALHYDPHLYSAHFNRGIARFEAGDQQGACADFSVAASNGVPQAAEALRQAGCHSSHD